MVGYRGSESGLFRLWRLNVSVAQRVIGDEPGMQSDEYGIIAKEITGEVKHYTPVARPAHKAVRVCLSFDNVLPSGRAQVKPAQSTIWCMFCDSSLWSTPRPRGLHSKDDHVVIMCTDSVGGLTATP